MATSITDVTATNQDKLTKYNVTLPEGKTAAEVTKGYVFEIKLNPNAKWENGEVINADDYIYSMQQLLSSEMRNYRANLYYAGESAVAGGLAYYNSEAPIYEAAPWLSYDAAIEWYALSSYISDYTVNDDGYVCVTVDGTEYVVYYSLTQANAFFGGSDSIKDYYDAGYTAYGYMTAPYAGDTSDPDALPVYVFAAEEPVMTKTIILLLMTRATLLPKQFITRIFTLSLLIPRMLTA